MFKGKKSLKKKNSLDRLNGDFSFSVYIKKIGKQVHPKLSIDALSLGNLNSFINLFIKKIVLEAIRFQNSSASVSPRST